MRDTFLYVAVGGETTIPVAGGYTPGQVIVVLNGVVLEPDTDVNVSSGTNIVFPSPLVTGDRVNFYRFRAFDVATAVAYIAQSLSPSEQAQARQNIGLGDILASLRYMGSIGSAEDLDTYTTPGVYVQNRIAWASDGTNYPVANAGMLEVLDGGGATNVQTVQRYTEYSQPPIVWQRMRRNGGNWSAWLNLSEWMATTVSQSEAEAGTATIRRAWTAERVRQNVEAAPVAAKAWVNFKGTGTVAIRDSYNVSSITDNGVADYTINFATPMANTNYAILTSVTHGGFGANPTGYVTGVQNAGKLTTSARVSAGYAYTSGGVDVDQFSAVIFGG